MFFSSKDVLKYYLHRPAKKYFYSPWLERGTTVYDFTCSSVFSELSSAGVWHKWKMQESLIYADDKEISHL